MGGVGGEGQRLNDALIHVVEYVKDPVLALERVTNP